jgi:hypothetical protein
MKRRVLKLDQQLSSIPVRNERVRAYPADDPDSLVVEVELKYPAWMSLLVKLLRMPGRKRYRLDGVGLQVYQSVDGSKSFQRLVDDFGEMHKLTFFEARALLMQYVKILMKRGLVVVALKKRDRK